MSSAPSNILLIEDDHRLAELTQRYLQQHDYHVVVEHNGDNALATFSRCQPDLILLDIMLPKQDGFTVCETIRANADWAGVKIIMLSAKSREADRASALAMGADEFITKPFSTRDLSVRVRELLSAGAA